MLNGARYMTATSRLRPARLSRGSIVAPVATKAAADTNCGRRSKRKSTTLPAAVIFEDMRSSLACTILDMSGSGARVQMAASLMPTLGDMHHLPDRLKLQMKADRMEVACKVMWRRDGQLGLRFMGPPIPTGRR